MTEIPGQPIDYKARVKAFASQSRFDSLNGTRFKRKAIEAAVIALEIPSERLLWFAEGLDHELVSTPFGYYQIHKSGTIFEAHYLTKTEMITESTFQTADGEQKTLRRYSGSRIDQVSTQMLRMHIGLRLVEDTLAAELGYKPGNEKAIIYDKNFITASHLTIGAIGSSMDEEEFIPLLTRE